ncbi:hypothetical protein Hte_009737 [Hypoxylon texense]
MAAPGPGPTPLDPQEVIAARELLARQEEADALAREAARIAQQELDEARRAENRQLNAERRQREYVKHLREELDAGHASWLRSEFQNISDYVKFPDILEALKILQGRGAALLTTNYDTLLENYCGFDSVDSGNEAGVLRWRRKSGNNYVFHPHGTWSNPSKLVLSTKDYYSVVRDKVIQDTMRATLTDKTILFIGCGTGLQDPNMGKLLEWVGREYGYLGARHYVLLPRGREVPIPRVPLNVVTCADFGDQSNWLRGLLGPGAAREGTVYEAPKRSERALVSAWLRPADQTQVVRSMLDHVRLPFDLVESVTGNATVWTGNQSLVLIGGRQSFGKTTLCSSIIENTRQACRQAQFGRSRDSLAYFLCDSEQYGFSVFCRTVIEQLCPPNHVFPALRELYESSTRFHPPRAPTAPQLHQVLVRILRELCPDPPTAAGQTQPGETYLIIDGVDHVETNERDLYLNLIRDIVSRNLQNFHLVVSARLPAQTRQVVQSWAPGPAAWRHILCDATAIEAAMEHYLRQCINNDPQFSRIAAGSNNAAIGNNIIQVIRDSQRSFNWAFHKMQLLKRLGDDITDEAQVYYVLDEDFRRAKRRRV